MFNLKHFETQKDVKGIWYFSFPRPLLGTQKVRFYQDGQATGPATARSNAGEPDSRPQDSAGVGCPGAAWLENSFPLLGCYLAVGVKTVLGSHFGGG